MAAHFHARLLHLLVAWIRCRAAQSSRLKAYVRRPYVLHSLMLNASLPDAPPSNAITNSSAPRPCAFLSIYLSIPSLRSAGSLMEEKKEKNSDSGVRLDSGAQRLSMYFSIPVLRRYGRASERCDGSADNTETACALQTAPIVPQSQPILKLLPLPLWFQTASVLGSNGLCKFWIQTAWLIFWVQTACLIVSITAMPSARAYLPVYLPVCFAGYLRFKELPAKDNRAFMRLGSTRTLPERGVSAMCTGELLGFARARRRTRWIKFGTRNIGLLPALGMLAEDLKIYLPDAVTDVVLKISAHAMNAADELASLGLHTAGETNHRWAHRDWAKAPRAGCWNSNDNDTRGDEAPAYARGNEAPRLPLTQAQVQPQQPTANTRCLFPV
ncbi:hypothetical protein C8R44DRAFT_728146 [Mycena epipterygia]|nr:hypothetical protein C8R44DRAFT_728146 [Mycena epipterygia]